jgi:hypothetical protein
MSVEICSTAVVTQLKSTYIDIGCQAIFIKVLRDREACHPEEPKARKDLCILLDSSNAGMLRGGRRT